MSPFQRRAVALICMAIAPLPAVAQDPSDYADLVQSIANNELQAWINDPVIIDALREQNERHASVDDRQIRAWDMIWRAETDSFTRPMINDLLDRQASVILRDRRQASSGIITEIFVMDRFGLNVAMSDPTSDYFQGDEAKWLETYLVGPNAVHVGDIEFDESTMLVQTQVSMSVTDPQTGEVIGAVTFGIDLDQIE